MDEGKRPSLEIRKLQFMTDYAFSTRAIHAGQNCEKEFGAVVPPIYLTSTYAQEYPGKPKKYDYSRGGNPNFANLEASLASLEKGEFSTVYNSGLGAISSILSHLKPGNRVVSIDDVYGGSFRVLQRVFQNFGIESVFGDMNDFSWIENELKKGAQIVWLETPTNPLLKVVDIKAVAELTHRYNAELVVDNTFASPYFQNPLVLGADLVLHSSTKYLGGHSDIIGGGVITNNAAWKEKLDFSRMAMGFNPSPFDTWLTSRSIKTLAVRMEKHHSNAMTLAKKLEQHPKVKKVFYPGLPSHPQHEIAKKQMSGFSGIISVILDMDLETTKKVIASFQLFILAESLGAVESLVNHPASMTHASIPREVRLATGVEDGLIRFSVGIEDPDDLWNDLNESLNRS